jgi:hypothetical protein
MSDWKRFAVWIGVLAWCFFSLVFDVRAGGVTVHKKLGTAHRVTGDYGGFGGPEASIGGGACTNPAAGTPLGGSETNNDWTSDYFGTANTGVWTNAGHQVTWAETCTETTVSKLQMWGAVNGVSNCKGIIYDNSGNIVTNGTSNGTSTTGWEWDWLDLTFATPPTLTKDATYKFVIVCDADGAITIGQLTTGGNVYTQGSFTYASPTAGPLAGSNAATATLQVRVVK